METNNNPNHTSNCTEPEVWVCNGGTEFVCHTCGERTPTGETFTTSVEENQFR